MALDWDKLNWAVLDRLRQGFLSGSAAQGPYWRNEEDLEHYDFTYAERIGWKWDAVLRELRQRGWKPRGGLLLDWGCGSGVASRRVLRHFGSEGFDSLLLWDHSAAAMDYAETKASATFPGLNVCQATPGFLASGGGIGLLVISHVLNELSAEALASLRHLILRSEAVLWVEAGTHEVSRGLQTIRDELRSEFSVLAPCTHAGLCPMLTPENERHWCHFFAQPPPGIFADSNWVKFGQRAGIDLRSLPYAFLALQKKGETSGFLAEGWSRVIGRPEHFKPYARVLSCDASGLHELTVPKRAEGNLYKELERSKEALVYRWIREGDKVLKGEGLAGSGS